MKKIITLFIAAVLMLAIATPAFAAGGFDQYGYNDTARIFNGTGSDWCLAGGQAAYCLGASSYDKLVMKWNAAWDACVLGTELACAGAWTTNEWNGRVPDGSNWMEHYKIIWVGPGGEASTYWQEGGYPIWGYYEVIMDQGLDPSNAHFSFALATPNGLGLNK